VPPVVTRKHTAPAQIAPTLQIERSPIAEPTPIPRIQAIGPHRDNSPFFAPTGLDPWKTLSYCPPSFEVDEGLGTRAPSHGVRHRMVGARCLLRHRDPQRSTRPHETLLRPIAPGNGSGSPPPWDLDRSGGLFFAPRSTRHRRSAGVAYSDDMPPTSSTVDPEKILRWIMAAVFVWGAILAAGSWTFNHDVRRPIVVLACVLAFLGFWNAMLAGRRRRMARADVPKARI